MMEKNGNKSVKSGVIVKRSKAPDSSYEASEARISESIKKYQERLGILAELIRKSKMIQKRKTDEEL
ncbi:hypothetical protein IM043_gp225 [Bacillus phage SPG24]|uniref:hypothetical protein n=1 Tax=Bacillus phage SPG24 TaxID=1497851 RepID=UPI0022BA4145|nr:hypothetical protein IM043_gp225 [Bacillus phage SPG24]